MKTRCGWHWEARLVSALPLSLEKQAVVARVGWVQVVGETRVSSHM